MARRLCSNGLPCHRILGAWNMPAKIAVGVITQRRPQQFAALLAKLAEQNTPAGMELHFIFVENDSAISVQPSVDRFKSALSSTGGNVHLELEPEIGISFARNRVLDIAKRLDMDWLALVDDDDLPTNKDWVCRLYQGCKNQGLTAGYGVNVYPDSRKPSKHRLLHQGSNVIFEMAFLRKNGIRYNVHLPVGEDVQFGLECIAKGASANVIADAIVQIGGRERFDDARFRFRRAMDEGMVKYGLHFRHLHVSNFHPIRTPAGVMFKLLTAVLNLLLAALFVPKAKIRAARHAGIVAGAVKGCLPRYRKVSLP